MANKADFRMMNLNYLGHKLKSRNIADLPNDYVCEACNVLMYFDKNEIAFDKNEIAFDYNNDPLMTCEEQQIKNLLE